MNCSICDGTTKMYPSNTGKLMKIIKTFPCNQHRCTVQGILTKQGEK